jgi:hypothetical protein
MGEWWISYRRRGSNLNAIIIHYLPGWALEENLGEADIWGEIRGGHFTNRSQNG